MKKKIISAVLSVVIVLSAFIIVPMTREVQAEAAYDPSLGMYSHLSNVFTGNELNSLVNTTHSVQYSYDSNERALMAKATSTDDPYIGFNGTSAGINLATYRFMVVIYKLPLSNQIGYPKPGFYWWPLYP